MVLHVILRKALNSKDVYKRQTNADVISISGSGIKTGLVSIPLGYMHTPVEVITETDVENTARLLCEYILKGGVGRA